ncbi:MAG TPA: exonuclease domain-containing protein [Ktedonobacteraceae bacterium]|nr:exonuclease domain-containing protein [Ktedonobacteraceae bacterium]
MAKKAPVRVALDLETTGLHAEQDSIVEIAAIKFQGETVLDTFETLVNPGRSIPYRVQRLTGITMQQLVGAPAFETIAQQLQAFLGDLPIVGHSIPFDAGFLRRRGLARNNPLIDTFELATVLLPSLPSYNLGQVAEALGVRVAPGRHRAMVDTVLAKDVFLALYRRLQAVDLGILQDIASMDAPRNWPLLAFLRQELHERQQQDGVLNTARRGSLGDLLAAQIGMDPRVLSFAIARADENTAPPALSLNSSPVLAGSLEQAYSSLAVAPAPQAVQTLQADRLAPAPQAEQTYPGYAAARKAVRTAFEQHAPLLMEVTIGGSDYTPVLQPALEWLAEQVQAGESGSARRLVIACPNQQAARRLMEAILPEVQATLKSELPVAYLAGRGGYLCIHRWFGAALKRTSGQLTPEQGRGMAKLGLWAQQTLTGERGELTMLPQEMDAWNRIASGVERIPAGDTRAGTAYQRCLYRRKGYCFVSRAEERVNAASIVVTTHAALLDDLSNADSLLSSIPQRLILDADLLEDEIARWSSREFDQQRLLELLNTVGMELPDGRYQGLLALAAPALREHGPGGLSTTPTISKSELDGRLLSWFQVVRQAGVAVETLFKAYTRLLEEYVQQGAGNGGKDKGRGETGGRGHGNRGSERQDQPLRLSNAVCNLGAWREVERAWQQAAHRLQAVIDVADEAEKAILASSRGRQRTALNGSEDDSIALELAACGQQLRELKQLAGRAMSLTEDQMVYWLRLSNPMSQPFQQRRQDALSAADPAAESLPVLYAQQVQTSAVIQSLLLNEGTGTIFAGSALAVDHQFSFSRQRFGLEIDTCSTFAISTERHEQTLLYLPDDVPEPNMPQYQRHLDEALIQLASVLEGQLVSLFTSHAALRSSYAAIKPILETRGILVLGHGIDGSPRQLWNIFQEQERVVLLGTGLFWDGTEEITRTPACILISRLPMPVLNDPPLAARVEHISNQLHQLTVPLASLRVRRVLNRLAWSDSRRNAVVLFDRRITSKEYGATVLHTLPRCSTRQAALSRMPETVLDWLTDSGSWDEK